MWTRFAPGFCVAVSLVRGFRAGAGDIWRGA